MRSIWAFCGPGPVGAEMVPPVEASLTWFEVDAASADELEAICLEGYLDGFRDAGRAGLRKDVEFGYLASLALRSALGAATPIVTIIRNDTLHPWVGLCP